MWAPIYYHAGNLFVYVSTGFVASDEAGAVAIGTRAIAPGIFTGQAVEIGKQRHVKATFSGLPVAILSGPTFDQVAARTMAFQTA